ncbi:UGSC family (seleno)protein [Qaidamihabitans albus]|uniref:UGSC family (seleno)protein n=1 Tax=Qaidamihabitans albus TaxID=2795733 RepID=UPI0018F24414|nr:UGSC family (seleno)protein [Qaidamihabitans albus]
MFEKMIDPTAGPDVAAGDAPRLAERTDRLDGLTVGLLANTKQNAAAFLDAVAESLAEEHAIADVVRRTKLSITDPVPPDILTELVDTCDVVVVGVGDCGSCSASAVVDGITLEAAGLPAAVICSDAFQVSADAMAGLRGSPGYRYVRTPHPVASLDADAVRERARTALPEIVGLLTGARPGAVAR